MSSEQPPESDRPSNNAADRLAVIVDAAERAALNVIDDAEKEAQRYLQEAQMRADRVVAERLRETADQIERNAGAGAGLTAPRLRPVEPAPAVKPAAEASDERGAGPEAEEKPTPGESPRVIEEVPIPIPPPAPTGSAAARLLATQMAVSGSSREEIETRLRNGFQIEDTSEILDAILGPEEKADA